MRKITPCLILILILYGVSPGETKSTDIKRASSQRSIDSTAVAKVLFPKGYDPDQFRLEEKKPMFPDDPCTVRMVGSAYWAIDGWIIGDEVYKAYQDVELLPADCEYPFYVTAVAIQMEFTYGGSIFVQADVEDLDPGSTEACPIPGLVVGISEEYEYEIPGEGNYLIIVVFEEPVLVDTSYFAGMYFGEGASDLGPAMFTDNDPYLCVSWNDWGLGWVDLISNPYYNFPGNLVMYSYGYNAGFVGPASSAASFYAPDDSSECKGTVSLRVADVADTSQLDQCVFEYSTGSSWTTIGSDTSPDITLRNSATPSTLQPGFSYSWSTSGLAQGWYKVRARAVKGGQDIGADTIDVYVDNTPLKATSLQPAMFATVCDTITIKAVVSDEDASLAQFELRESSNMIQHAWPLLDQFDFGDANGNPNDNNSVFQGEFGDYYNGPTIAASALSYFSNMGYPELMYVGATPRSVQEMVEVLADSMNVRDRRGTQDDNMMTRLKYHFKSNGDEIDLTLMTSPTVEDIFYYMEYRCGLVMLGITQPYGYWLGLGSLTSPPSGTGEMACGIYDTRTGAIQSTTLDIAPTLAVNYGGAFRTVDCAIAIYPAIDTVIGGDYSPANGLSYFWNRSGFTDGWYYLAAVTMDLTNRVAEKASHMQLACQAEYTRGDANGSGEIDIDDIVYIIAYIFQAGPAPVPELAAGDPNCQSGVDIDDIVYLVAYIFQAGPPPCQ